MDRPEIGVARARDAAADRDRIVAAIARHIDIGMLGEGGAIAFVAEAPGGATVIDFELGTSFLRSPVGEIRNRIEAVDRKPGIAVGHDLLGGGGPRARMPESQQPGRQTGSPSRNLAAPSGR